MSGPKSLTWFQSTPSVSRGRCLRYAPAAPLFEGFNPRPPFPEGDASHPSRLQHGPDVSIHALRFQRAMPPGRQWPGVWRLVSIHALRFQRAMLQMTAQVLAWAVMFQSTPSVSRGRCDAGLRFRVPHHVSIHALRFQRAMRPTAL